MVSEKSLRSRSSYGVGPIRDRDGQYIKLIQIINEHTPLPVLAVESRPCYASGQRQDLASPGHVPNPTDNWFRAGVDAAQAAQAVP